MTKKLKPHREADIRAISDWIVREALGDFQLPALFEEMCRRMVAIGIPLARVNLGFETLHPMFIARVFLWEAGEGASVSALPHDFESSEEWQVNPVRPLVEEDREELRHRLETPGAWPDLPVLRELCARGMTDYIAMRTRFQSADAPENHFDGLVGAWTTTRPGGFSDGELDAIRRLHRRFGLAAKIAKREETSLNILSAYLGGDAAARVMNGQIRLGDGDVIPSVIWYSDMRGSTALAEALEQAAFLDALNSYFQCAAGAVLSGGGDVLRFIGDAVLGIFPIGEGRLSAAEACARALAAAADAQTRMAAVNSQRAGEGLVELDFGLGLHIGEVLFGNIGVPERVEFSVIGPAANEVARIEGMTKALGRRVLMSADFAAHVAAPLEDLGAHALAGVGAAKRLFTPR